MAARLAAAAVCAALAAALGTVAALDGGLSLRVALPALLLVLAGFWFAGACLAGIVTFGELLAHSLRRELAAVRDPAP